MADKKLSSVSAVSDMNYVYAETSTGETVKISKADLASVVAGLMPSATLTSRGFMPAGLYMSPVKKYADAGASITLGDLNGFLLVRDSYSWSGYSLFWCSGASAIQVMISPNGIAYSVTYESGVGYKLTNNSDRRRAYSFIYQNIPIAE